MKNGTQISTDTWQLPRSVACCYACTLSAVEYSTEYDMAKRFRCAQGFSALQINILGVIKAHASLSEEDINFHWPTLAKDGFGTVQIRQICQRLHKIGSPLNSILQGLAHAEWEMARGSRKDSKGNPIERPAHWVFETLARQGYYPRPTGYISPQEQAERDAAEEHKRLAEALDARLEAAQTAWAAQLSPEEKVRIIQARYPAGNGSVRIPESVVLRGHFRTEIWPLLQQKDVPA